MTIETTPLSSTTRSRRSCSTRRAKRTHGPPARTSARALGLKLCSGHPHAATTTPSMLAATLDYNTPECRHCSASSSGQLNELEASTLMTARTCRQAGRVARVRRHPRREGHAGDRHQEPCRLHRAAQGGGARGGLVLELRRAPAHRNRVPMARTCSRELGVATCYLGENGGPFHRYFSGQGSSRVIALDAIAKQQGYWHLILKVWYGEGPSSCAASPSGCITRTYLCAHSSLDCAARLTSGYFRTAGTLREPCRYQWLAYITSKISPCDASAVGTTPLPECWDRAANTVAYRRKCWRRALRCRLGSATRRSLASTARFPE